VANHPKERLTRPGDDPEPRARSLRRRFSSQQEPQTTEIDRRGFLRRMDGMLAAYEAAMSPPRDQMPGRRAIMERHSTYPSFRGFTTERRGRLPGTSTVGGFTYGFHGARGQWWHDVVFEALVLVGGQEHAKEWLADSFEVAELHVRPEYQGRGIGRDLLTRVCAGRAERTVVLSTLDADTPARHLYRSVGMTDLLSAYHFPGGGPLYAVMGTTLPLRSSKA
jgi:ribosomal protein S18 acetylase RimI-like enzyme